MILHFLPPSYFLFFLLPFASTCSSPILFSFASVTRLPFLLSLQFHLLLLLPCPSPLPTSLSTHHFPFIPHTPPHLLSVSPYFSLSVTFNFPFYLLRSAFRALFFLHLQVSYCAYFRIGGLFSVVKLFCGGLLFWFFVRFSLGMKLLTTVATLFNLSFL